MGAHKAALLSALLVASGCNEKTEMRCYTPGSVINPGEGVAQKIPDLPCLPRQEAEPYLSRACQRMTVDTEPDLKSDQGSPRCCYDVTYEKMVDCQVGRPLLVAQAPRAASLARSGAWR